MFLFGKVPFHNMRYIGGVEVYLYSFVTASLDGKKTRYSLNRRLGGAPEPVWAISVFKCYRELYLRNLRVENILGRDFTEFVRFCKGSAMPES
jgi:hypothetical protein